MTLHRFCLNENPAVIGRSLILDSGYWMFIDTTYDGMQVIKYRASSIQHRPGNGNSRKHNYKAGLIKFMHRQGLYLLFFR